MFDFEFPFLFGHELNRPVTEMLLGFVLGSFPSKPDCIRVVLVKGQLFYIRGSQCAGQRKWNNET